MWLISSLVIALGARGGVQDNSYHLSQLSVREFIRRVMPTVKQIVPNAVVSENPQTPISATQYLVIADPAKNTLTLASPSDSSRQFIQMVREFDVAPKRLDLSIQFKDLDENTLFTATSSTSNECGTSFSDDRSGTLISVRPRINADGTITYSVELKLRNDFKTELVSRMAMTDNLYVTKDGWVNAHSDSSAEAMFKDGHRLPGTDVKFDKAYPFELKISAKVVEKKK